MEQWEQDLVTQEYLLRSEKTKAETKLLEKQAAHIDVIAELAAEEKKKNSQVIAIELKRQINHLGCFLTEHEAEIKVVLDAKVDLANFLVDKNEGLYEQRRDLWRIDQWLAKNQAAYDFTLKQIENLKTELLQHLTKEA